MSTTLRLCTGVSFPELNPNEMQVLSLGEFDKHANLSGVMTALQATGSEIKFIISLKSIPSITIIKIDYYMINPKQC